MQNYNIAGNKRLLCHDLLSDLQILRGMVADFILSVGIVYCQHIAEAPLIDNIN